MKAYRKELMSNRHLNDIGISTYSPCEELQNSLETFSYCKKKSLNELGKRDKMRGLSSISSLFRNEFNTFNNTGARMLDPIYHVV